MISIVKFLWKGDRWNGSENMEEYVNKLFRSVRKQSAFKYEFILYQKGADLSKLDDQMTIRIIHTPSWMGVFPKLSIYNPDNQFTDQVFVFDLHSILVGGIDSILSYRGDFCSRLDDMVLEAHNQRCSGGGLISFNPNSGKIKSFWNNYVSRPEYYEQNFRGRERFVYRKFMSDGDYWQDLYPGQLLSYKVHVQKNNDVLPKGAKVVWFHGHPRPHELVNPPEWVKEFWV